MKKLRIWWIPQVPGKQFNVKVENLKEASSLLDTLANYDRFQYDNNIKSDYCNAGGLQEFDEELNDWTDWYDEDSGMDFDEYREENLI